MDSKGNRVTLEEYAANVGAARYRLEIQGYENLELVSDDLKFRVDQAIGNEEVWNDLTVAERQRFEEEVASGHPVITTLWQIVRAQKWLILGLTAGVAWCATGSNPWGIGSWIVYAFAALWLWLTAAGLLIMLQFSRLEIAKNWQRWDQVLAIVGKLRKKGLGVPEFHLRFAEAKAMAARGDVPGAIEHVREVANEPTMDRWVYLGLLSGVYDIGLDYENAVKCLEDALAGQPDSASAKIDLAFALAQRKQEFTRAGALLDEIDMANVPKIAHSHVNATRGMIALEEGRLEEAERLFREAAISTVKTAGIRAQNGMAFHCEAYLAIALRAQGREAEAAKVYAQVEPWLRVNREDEIIRQWDRAAAATSGV